MSLELCKRVKKVKNIKDIVYQYTEDTAGSLTSVLVRHPDYFLRFNAIRNALIQAADPGYYKKKKEWQQKVDNNQIIDSFFSPFINFDKAEYLRVRPLRKTVTHKNLKVFCLSHIGLTRIVKAGIYMRFIIEKIFQPKSMGDKKILY